MKPRLTATARLILASLLCLGAAGAWAQPGAAQTTATRAATPARGTLTTGTATRAGMRGMRRGGPRPVATPFVNPQPDVPYLPKPEPRPADWIVEHAPVTPNASPEARELLKFLYKISGKYTLTGQHNFPAEQMISTAAATRALGKTPALYGTDWGFAREGDKDSAYVRPATVQELIRQHQKGSIIAICWHAVRPTENEPVTFRESVQGKITNAEFDELITTGTALNKRWLAQVDVIAGYLKQLQAARVPVLWRPMHEINGDWFWWNGRRGDRGTKQLYRLMFERLVGFHKLNNLIWVWNPDQPAREDRQFVDYFPGQQYVDILALDCYGAFQQRFYDELNALSDGKVLAVSECSNPPGLEVYRTQPKWTYYMSWAGMGTASGRGARGGAGGTTPVMLMARDTRMFSLEDASYLEAIKPIRLASGLATVPQPATPAALPVSNPVPPEPRRP